MALNGSEVFKDKQAHTNDQTSLSQEPLRRGIVTPFGASDSRQSILTANRHAQSLLSMPNMKEPAVLSNEVLANHASLAYKKVNGDLLQHSSTTGRISERGDKMRP